MRQWDSAAQRTTPPGRGLAPRSIAALTAALFLAIFGFLPIATWLSGGPADGFDRDRLAGWASGSALAIGVGIVLAVLSGRLRFLWPSGPARRFGAWAERHGVLLAVLMSAAAVLIYGLVARLVFDGRPILIDELAQMRQAQMLAGGHLWVPVSSHPEFFSSLNMVDAAGRLYAQFPMGGPVMLAAGVVGGAPWLVDPVCAGVSVLLAAQAFRMVESDARVAALATAVFAFAPFTVFMSGSHMNHVTALMWILLGVAALVTDMASAAPRPMIAFLSGFGFGAAATIRPVDALAFAAPAAVWYLARVLRDRARWSDAALALVGVAMPIAAMLWINAATTGHPLLFGYEVLWGRAHELGFHAAPWGQAHTPARGLRLVSLYFLRLQDYLFETPIPSLVPAIVALALSRRLRPADRYLLASAALLVGLYFLYWHDGFYLGPRFVYALLPVLALWTARSSLAVARTVRRWPIVWRACVFAAAASAAVAVAYAAPLRASQYRANARIERWSRPGVAAAAGVRGALVFVREAWEDQVVARLWALDVSHPEAELLYRTVDICRLDSAVGDLEAARDAGAVAGVAADRLRPLLTDSSAVAMRQVAPGMLLAVQRDYAYPAWCVARLDEMFAGTAPLAPMQLLGGAGGGRDTNIYARDLGPRDTILLRVYPARPVYLVRAASADPGALPAFFSISRDSVWRAARRNDPNPAP